MDFFITYIFLPLAGLLILLLTVALGGLPASMVENGRKGVVFATAITVIVVGALYAWFGYMIWDMAVTRFRDPANYSGAYIGFATAALCILVCPIHTLLTGSTRAQYLRDMAPRVVTLAERYFATIDSDHNGIVIDGELKQAITSMRLDSEEMAVLKHMRTELSEVGHVIDTYTTTTMTWTPIGKGGMMLPSTTTHNIYGIDQSDLASYPARVVEKYKYW